MNIGVNFWIKKEIFKVIFHILVISSISLLGNYFYEEYNKTNNTNTSYTKVSEQDYNQNSYFEDEPSIEQPKTGFVHDNKNKIKRKKAYLTFDDGPSYNITPKILDVLKNKKVKATFFVIGKNVKEFPNLIIREESEGHSIGNHSYSHNYKSIYANVENFLSEINETDKALKEVLGDKYNKKIFRFPGGSFNRGKQFKEVLKEKDYEFYDWNCLNGDAEGINVSKDKLINKVKSTAMNQEKLIILMHDMETKETTYEALSEIIDYLQVNNYDFEVL